MVIAGQLGVEARRRGWYDTKQSGAEKAPLSVVLMNGGRLFVPSHEYSVFLAAYGADVAAGVRHYVVERATEPSRWYADIDLCGAVFTADQWLTLVRALHARLCELAGTSTTLLVLEAEATETGAASSKNGADVVGGADGAGGADRAKDVDGALAGTPRKTGIHLVAPELTVTMQQMLEWRTSLAHALGDASVGADVSSQVDWDEALDQAVYKGGGSLRLVLSRKMAPCRCRVHTPSCCGGLGKIDAGRPYVLKFYLGRNGLRDEACELALRSNAHLLVHRSSIRRVASETASAASVAASAATAAPRGVRAARRDFADFAAGASGSDGGTLDTLLEGLPAAHRDLHVVRDAHGTRLRVRGAGARWCEIAQREHRSSTVYYVLDELRGTATQRCWCPKGECGSGAVAGPYRMREESVSVGDGTGDCAHARSHNAKRLPPGFVWR